MCEERVRSILVKMGNYTIFIVVKLRHKGFKPTKHSIIQQFIELRNAGQKKQLIIFKNVLDCLFFVKHI